MIIIMNQFHRLSAADQSNDSDALSLFFHLHCIPAILFQTVCFKHCITSNRCLRHCGPSAIARGALIALKSIAACRNWTVGMPQIARVVRNLHPTAWQAAWVRKSSETLCWSAPFSEATWLRLVVSVNASVSIDVSAAVSQRNSNSARQWERLNTSVRQGAFGKKCTG